MSSEYSISQYLLDRANVEDVIKDMYLNVDHRTFDALVTSVFADEIHVDYTSLLGGEPYTVSSKEQAAAWNKQTGSFKASQHAITSVSTQLPQPGPAKAPDTVSAVANGITTLVLESGKVIHNCGRLYVSLVRSEKGPDNPWRITSMRVEKVWENKELGEDAKKGTLDEMGGAKN